MPEDASNQQDESQSTDRRTFLSTASSLTMAGGLLAGYGTFFYMAGRFLYPAHDTKRAWVFVAKIDDIEPGKAITFQTPLGESVNITRNIDSKERPAAIQDFLALSSICPHLGCRVHWEGPKNRFYCPCHQGVFDPNGKPLQGPPADANQSLTRYQLKLQNDMLFIEVPVEGLTTQPDSAR